jgi:UDP-sulfoquinovose synthase
MRMGFDFGAGERRLVDYTRRVAHHNVVHIGLEKLELKPQLLSDTLIESMFGIVEANKHRVVVDKPYPEVRWTATSNT